MARRPKPLGRETLAASIMDLALQYKAAAHGVPAYSISDLSRESELNHSVISRAIQYQASEESGTKQPTLATVKKMATTLGLATNPELETLFYNSFGYASPTQLTKLKTYITEHLEEH